MLAGSDLRHIGGSGAPVWSPSVTAMRSPAPVGC